MELDEQPYSGVCIVQTSELPIYQDVEKVFVFVYCPSVRILLMNKVPVCARPAYLQEWDGSTLG